MFNLSRNPMTPHDVKTYFKSLYNFNICTRMSPVTLSNWIKKGKVPLKAQTYLEIFTNGILKADEIERPISYDQLLEEVRELRAFKENYSKDCSKMDS